jgi:hypothetical protein
MKAILTALNILAALIMLVMPKMLHYVEAVKLSRKLAELQQAGVLSTNALPVSFIYETTRAKTFDDFDRLRRYLQPTKQYIWPADVACLFFMVNAVLIWKIKQKPSSTAGQGKTLSSES